MKTLIIVLIIISFLQTTIIPLDLVLVILICRAYLNADSTNLYLAFGFGLLVSFLKLDTVGLQSISYLVFIQLTQMLSKSPLAGRSLLIVPISFVFLFFNQTSELFPKVILESVLSLPILYIIRFWEERFIAKEIRLKI